MAGENSDITVRLRLCITVSLEGAIETVFSLSAHSISWKSVPFFDLFICLF